MLVLMLLQMWLNGSSCSQHKGKAEQQTWQLSAGCG
jgi:hypothetical protein